LHVSIVGHGPAVLMLHGGLASSDYWGNQARVLSPAHTVVLLDSRGEGRSGWDKRPIHYGLMADDAIAVLDALGIVRADVVGWSDGAIVGLDLAMRDPSRVRRVFAFAANADPEGTRPDAGGSPVFAAYLARARREYAAFSPAPGRYPALLAALDRMWASEPRWDASRLGTIRAEVAIVDGDHDEAIRPDHTAWIARSIPGARMIWLHGVSHFAFLQDPAAFDAAMLAFLDR
jgi:pimeloyl-ACP methyl ester carboxylesterase